MSAIKRSPLLLGVFVVVAIAVGIALFFLLRPSEEKALKLVYWQAPSILNPYLSGGDKDISAAAITLKPLANHDPEGVLVPALAAEVPTLENGGVSAA